ncbi:MAG TPA: ABC transporter ATP-binding protein [Verrucomicrobiae bacterium]
MKIELRAVSKSYGKSRALDRASLEIGAGQIVAILGANGAGKTTLLRCLAGIAAADSGAIVYNDEPFERDNLELRRGLFFLPDFPVVFYEMSVVRHIGMVLRVYERDEAGIEARVLQLLKEFDLLAVAENPLSTLSRGQVYKAALVALIAVNPQVWLLDEPFASGMDPHGINSLKRFAREAAGQGRTIIYSTQILEIVEKFSDKVCILHQGEVRAFDSVTLLENARQGAGLETIFQQLREEVA